MARRLAPSRAALVGVSFRSAFRGRSALAERRERDFPRLRVRPLGLRVLTCVLTLTRARASWCPVVVCACGSFRGLRVLTCVLTLTRTRARWYPVVVCVCVSLCDGPAVRPLAPFRRPPLLSTCVY